MSAHGCMAPCPICKQGCPICNLCDLAMHRREASTRRKTIIHGIDIDKISSAAITPVHKHQFTVPVEWEHTNYEEITTSDYGYFKPGTVSVTKLRCSGCTEEVERA